MLSERQMEFCDESRWDFSGLRAVFLNCTLKRSPELSHTEGLIDISKTIMEANHVHVDVLRPVDHRIAFGVWGDMTGHGWEADDWPAIYGRVREANIPRARLARLVRREVPLSALRSLSDSMRTRPSSMSMDSTPTTGRSEAASSPGMRTVRSTVP